jgi:hypothetical protein
MWLCVLAELEMQTLQEPLPQGIGALELSHVQEAP